MWLIVQVHTGHSSLRHGPLYLRPFVPFVKRRDGDHLRPHAERCLQGCLVVTAIYPVASVVIVPRSNAGVDVTRSNTGDEKKVVSIAEGLDGLPVLVRGAKGEAVGSEVSVHAVEAARENVMLVPLLNDQSNENRVIGRATNTVGACGSQKFRPGLRWSQIGVINVEERKALPSAGGESVESPMVPIPLETNRRKTETLSTELIYYIILNIWPFSILYFPNSCINITLSSELITV